MANIYVSWLKQPAQQKSLKRKKNQCKVIKTNAEYEIYFSQLTFKGKYLRQLANCPEFVCQQKHLRQLRLRNTVWICSGVSRLFLVGQSLL